MATQTLKPSPQAALVLGLPLQPDGTPRPAMIRRLNKALQLHHSGEISHLILCGGDTGSVHSEAEGMRRYLLEQGIPPEHLILEDRSLNTWQNAQFGVEIAKAHGWQHIGVISDPAHLLRALRSVRAHGLKAQGYPAPIGGPLLSRVRFTLREWLAWAYYGLRYRNGR